MNLWEALVLGIVEGLTEFLPISSTGHLTIAEKMMGLDIDDPSVTAFTAVIQSGAIAAVLIYFRSDLARVVGAFSKGVRSSDARNTPDWRFALCVIVGSLPIGFVGLAAKDIITGPLRNLEVVGAALVLWSIVMVIAERRGAQNRAESDITLRDALIIGSVQCLALIPGVSRSGATISAGLLRNIDRVTATRLSFLLSIPALTGAAIYQSSEIFDGSVGWAPTLVGTVVSFVVAYASIAWLLRFVAHHTIVAFVPYRVVVGAAVLIWALL